MQECVPFLTTILVGLALAAVTVDSVVAAGRAALVTGSATHREAWLLNTGPISHDGCGQKSSFTTKLWKPITGSGPDRKVAFGRARDEVLRMAADRTRVFRLHFTR